MEIKEYIVYYDYTVEEGRNRYSYVKDKIMERAYTAEDAHFQVMLRLKDFINPVAKIYPYEKE